MNRVRLHYVEAGDSTSDNTVILLHGFPGFWYCWRNQIPALAAAGFRVIAPDMRGYNASGKPPRVEDYRVEHLAADVAALAAQFRPGGRIDLVGHDWGGVVAWYAAMRHPEVLRKLAIVNAPHPAAYLRELRRLGSGQLLRSWYAFSFQVPWLPETVLAANDFALLRRTLTHEPVRPEAFTPHDVQQYARAWSQPGALRAGVNYYRAAVRRGLKAIARDVRRIDTPVLMIWGDSDRYLVPALTQGLGEWVKDVRVERIAGASHWALQDEPERVNGLLLNFLNE